MDFPLPSPIFKFLANQTLTYDDLDSISDQFVKTTIETTLKATSVEDWGITFIYVNSFFTFEKIQIYFNKIYRKLESIGVILLKMEVTLNLVLKIDMIIFSN